MFNFSQVGRYQILEMLGQGGVGEVYRAYDPDLDRDIALKLITRPDTLNQAEWLTRFKREVRAAAQLKHPNIVTVYDVGLTHTPPFVVMELFTGGSLKDHLKNRALPWAQAVQMLLPLCQALAFAHQVGVIHRDIKPGNIMLVDEAARGLKLVDFGLARQQGSETVTDAGGVLGTPAYMSPEQADGQIVDARADIFALGLIFIEAITGKNPLDHGSISSTIMAVIAPDPVDLTSLAAISPPELVAILGRAVAKDREQRYHTAESFAQDLKTLLGRTSQAAQGVAPGSAAVPSASPFNDRLLIENPAGLSLPLEGELVLKAAFPHCGRVVVRESLPPYHQDRHILVVRPIRQDSTPEIPTIIKLAPIHLIRQEWEAYHTCIRDKLPGVAEIKGEPVLPAGSSWGALRYAWLGGNDSATIQNLAAYFRQANLEDILFVLQERLFSSLGARWLFNQARPEFSLQTGYDHLLPANLTIQPLTPPQDVAVQPINPSTRNAQTLKQGDYVQLSGFIITAVQPQQQAVTLNLPSANYDLSPAYQLRLAPVENISQYQVNNVIDSVTGVITTTRFDHLTADFQSALGPEIDLGSKQLTLNQGQFPNPLIALPEILTTSRDVRVACIHSNLTLENVLVDPHAREIRLIDFENSGQNHVLHDLLRLETSVITHLLPRTLAEAGLPPTTIISLYEQLHQVVRNPEMPHPALIHTSLEVLWEILLATRNMARNFLFAPNVWSEYYQGLTIYLLGATNHLNPTTSPDNVPVKQLAFWGAVAAQKLLSVSSPTGVFHHPPPSYTRQMTRQSKKAPTPASTTVISNPTSQRPEPESPLELEPETLLEPAPLETVETRSFPWLRVAVTLIALGLILGLGYLQFGDILGSGNRSTADTPLTSPPNSDALPVVMASTATLTPAPPTATPTSRPTDTPVPTVTPSATLTAIIAIIETATATPIIETPTSLSTPTETLTPTPQPTATAILIPQPVADSTRQFSSVQGASRWQYQWSLGRDSFDWREMVYDGTCWRTTNDETSMQICQDTAHPGLSGDIAWRWTSNLTGDIRASISARKLDTAGGDGVTIHLFRNLEQVNSWHLPFDDSRGIDETITVNVNPDDYLFFVLKMNQNPVNDLTAFQAQIYR